MASIFIPIVALCLLIKERVIRYRSATATTKTVEVNQNRPICSRSTSHSISYYTNQLVRKFIPIVTSIKGGYRLQFKDVRRSKPSPELRS